jgi:hypothetical protein
MRDFAIMISLTLPMQVAGLTLLFIDEAAASAAYVIGANLVAVVLAIIRGDLARLWRVHRQGHGGRRDGLTDYYPVPDATEIVAWF